MFTLFVYIFNAYFDFVSHIWLIPVNEFFIDNFWNQIKYLRLTVALQIVAYYQSIGSFVFLLRELFELCSQSEIIHVLTPKFLSLFHKENWLIQCF